jgi:hypothetical protein
MQWYSARDERPCRQLFAVIRAYLDDLDAGRFVFRPGCAAAHAISERPLRPLDQVSQTEFRTRIPRGDIMDLIVLATLAAIGWWLYRKGKAIGSRKGYHAGRSRRKRRS